VNGMPPKDETKPARPPYPTCPSCGSTNFQIDGYVCHVQPYDAKLADYGVSRIEWDDDIPTGARCAKCERDSTDLLKEYGVLTFYRPDLKVR
jgi:hypothetical protein